MGWINPKHSMCLDACNLKSLKLWKLAADPLSCWCHLWFLFFVSQLIIKVIHDYTAAHTFKRTTILCQQYVRCTAPARLIIITFLICMCNDFISQISNHDTVQEIRQVVLDRPESCFRTCFSLHFNGNRLDDFVELHTVEEIQEESIIKVMDGKDFS